MPNPLLTKFFIHQIEESFEFFWKIFQCYSKVLGEFVGVVVVKIGEIKHCFMAVPNKSQIKIRICL